MSATVQNKFQVCYVYIPTTKCQQMSGNIYLEMLGTYPTAGIHETVRY